MKRNYIAGEWVAGAGARANVNPSDLSDVIETATRRPEPRAKEQSR
jgi:hypothetical protein